MSVVIVQTGIANTASVAAALRRAGAEPVLTSDLAAVERAKYLVLPGVGSFRTAVSGLEAAGLTEPLRRRVEAGRPTLAICLGMQLLCEESEESSGARGLGIIRDTVRRLRTEKPVPQLGWNVVRPAEGAEYLTEGYAYFANSFALFSPPAGWTSAITNYDVDFVSAIERGAVLACQFHPELSGKWGGALIKRWLDGGAEC